ncbi:MAG: hypothetical protein HXS48_06515 [Theionarchaea archaeon]|nr:hypothetical protein [Theionarchaea archaeon]
MLNIGILTNQDDLHALVVKHELDAFGDVNCRIVETDVISGTPSCNWREGGSKDGRSGVFDRDGNPLDPRSLDVIWWRRVNSPQIVPNGLYDEVQRDLIDQDCRSTLLGLFMNEFHGTWINEPSATRLAENKLIQLKAARATGLDIPDTLVSQDPAEIRLFVKEHKGNVVIKPVQGTRLRPLFTRKLRTEHLESDVSLMASPAIYQEYIEGSKHLRIHCFGDRFFTASIETSDLDWRENLNVPFNKIDLDEKTESHITDLLQRLGLKMGVMTVS